MSKLSKALISILLCMSIILSINSFLVFGATNSTTKSGILKQDDGDYILQVSSTNYYLIGNTSSLKKYIGKNIKVEGVISTVGKLNIISVSSFKLTEEDTDTKVQGLLYQSSDKKKYILYGEKYKYELTGQINKIDSYLGKRIEVNGKAASSPSTNKITIFKVTSFSKVKDKNAVEKISGKVIKVINAEKGIYQLKTDKGAVALIGSLNKFDRYIGGTAVLEGRYINLNLSEFTSFSVFEVESYKAIEATYDIHSIMSNKVYYFKELGSNETKKISGLAILSWNEATKQYFYDAKISLQDGTEYEIKMTKLNDCSSSTINGMFDIYKDGSLFKTNIKGTLSDLDEEVNDRYNFQSSDNQWLLSSYITSRIDM